MLLGAAHVSPRIPWSLIGALCILVAFEFGLRVSGYPRIVPYLLGIDEYHSVQATLDAQDVPEVVFVGSSRTRESIHAPTLRETLTAQLGRDVAVGNYGVSRGRAFDFQAIVRRLLREPVPPRVIVCGISERDLSPGTDSSFDQAPYFWTFADWADARRQHPTLPSSEWLPVVVRNAIAQSWHTLRYRESLRLSARYGLLGVPEDGQFAPPRGEGSVWQSTERTKSLAQRPISDEQVRAYVARLELEGFPDQDMLVSFEGMLADCARANVTLIVYDVPVPQVFKDFSPAGLNDRFLDLVESTCRRHNVRFVRSDTLPVSLGRYHFREQSHMNWRGAQAFSRTFAEAVLVPTLKTSQSLPHHSAGN